MKRLSLFLLLLSQSFLLLAQSPMAKGRWARVKVEANGLYVLDQAFLKASGFSSIDKLSVWGYGGGILPEVNKLLVGHRLKQVPTYLKNGKLYFYGEGLVQWYYSRKKDFFYHKTNHYTKEAYYLVSENTAQPLRMQEEEVEQAQQGGSQADRYTIATRLMDFSDMSIAHSGRKLYSSLLYQPNVAEFKLRGAKSVQMNLAFMGYPKKGREAIRIDINGQEYFTESISRSEVSKKGSAYEYHFFGMDKEHLETESMKLNPASPQMNVSITAFPRKTSIQLDYYELNFQQEISTKGGAVVLRRKPSKGADLNAKTTYTFDHRKGWELFALDKVGLSGQPTTKHLNLNEFSTQASLSLSLPYFQTHGMTRSYLLLNLAQAKPVHFVSLEPNQNILGDKRRIDLLIICPKALKGQARRLAQHYETKGKVSAVWSDQEIYNEFNGGTADAMAYRLVARHYYDLSVEQKGAQFTSPLNILLFGDAAYDNRRILKEWQKESLQKANFLLCYESENSLDLETYTSDDFFGVLRDEDKEPSMKSLEAYDNEMPSLAHQLMDVPVGRFPVRNEDEAFAVVNKIIAYDNDQTAGSWRMRATFVADNGDGNSHTEQSVDLTNCLEQVAPAMLIKKIYMSAYLRESVGGQMVCPRARKELFEAFEKGQLLVNYNGHGGPNKWTQEKILSFADVQGFSHKKLPLFVTATCDFSPFDETNTSAGEAILLHETSGGIALLSTTRVVWDLPNKALNEELLKELFQPNEAGTYPTLGQAVMRAKNTMRSLFSPENRLNFVLLGSPLQKLALPPARVVLTSSKDQAIASEEELKVHALEQVKLSGQIQNSDGSIDGDFTGKVEVFVYDSEQDLLTIDNFGGWGEVVKPVPYRDFLNLIYTNTVEVQDGNFSFDFIVPKDVVYSDKTGKIAFYAYDEQRRKSCMGYARNLRILQGGKNDESADQEAPKLLSVQLSGKDVDTTPLVPEISKLFVRLSEAHGLNLSSAGIGHQMQLVIDGRRGQTIDLSPYYSNVEGSKTLATINYALPPLASGRHHALLRVCDVYNNVVLKSFDFVVQRGLKPQIDQLSLSMMKGGMLIIQHDQKGMPLLADIDIFAMSGARLLSKSRCLIPASSAFVAYKFKSLGLGAIMSLPPATYILRLRLYSDSKDAVSAYKSIKFVKP